MPSTEAINPQPALITAVTEFGAASRRAPTESDGAHLKITATFSQSASTRLITETFSQSSPTQLIAATARPSATDGLINQEAAIILKSVAHLVVNETALAPRPPSSEGSCYVVEQAQQTYAAVARRASPNTLETQKASTVAANEPTSLEPTHIPT